MVGVPTIASMTAKILKSLLITLSNFLITTSNNKIGEKKKTNRMQLLYACQLVSSYPEAEAEN
jgi:hypothetical protein